MKEDADDAQLQTHAVLQDKPDDVNAIPILSQLLTQTFKYNGNMSALNDAIRVGEGLAEQEDGRNTSQLVPHAFLVI